jgi:hypothetical protein
MTCRSQARVHTRGSSSAVAHANNHPVPACAVGRRTDSASTHGSATPVSTTAWRAAATSGTAPVAHSSAGQRLADATCSSPVTCTSMLAVDPSDARGGTGAD